MARASSNSKVKNAAKASSAEPTKKSSTQAEKLRAIALPELREELKNQVGNDAPKIVTSLIDAAAKDSCGHAKYVCEMIGLYPAAALDQEDLEEDSPAKTLLRRLGLPEDPPVIRNRCRRMNWSLMVSRWSAVRRRYAGYNGGFDQPGINRA